MTTEITMTIVSVTGNRYEKGSFSSLTDAHVTATERWNIKGEQISEDETIGVSHAHIMEFRDGEHYNDIYLK